MIAEYSAVGMVIEEVGQPVVNVIGKVELRKFMEELRMTESKGFEKSSEMTIT